MKRTAVSIAHRENEYQVVVLGRKGETYEFQHRSNQSPPASWDNLGAEMFELSGSASGGGGPIVGYDSGRVIFYRFKIPAAKGEELETMIALQAEALLPLPMEEMELAWRTGAEQNGKVSVTIATARRSQLEDFSQKLQQCRPGKILLESEAIVKAWQVFFAGGMEKAAIIYTGKSNTQICLTEQGRLALAVTSDVGQDDLMTVYGLREPSAERLAQDIRSSLERFDDSAVPDRQVHVLTNGSSIIEHLADYLNRVGLKTQIAAACMDKLNSPAALSPQELYDYLIPTGLALMGLDDGGQELNLFERLYRAKEESKKRQRVPSLKVSAVLLAMMLAVFAIVSSEIDAARLKRFQRYREEMETTINLSQIEKESKLKKAIASQRVNILDLLSLINACNSEGEMLDSFSFKRNQSVTIIGRTKNRDKIFEFQQNLQKQKDIKGVRVQNRKLDSKKKEITYTITFDYKNFGKK